MASLHNVEITISGEEFEESVRTKTDNRGNLNMPWPIPDAGWWKTLQDFCN